MLILLAPRALTTLKTYLTKNNYILESIIILTPLATVVMSSNLIMSMVTEYPHAFGFEVNTFVTRAVTRALGLLRSAEKIKISHHRVEHLLSDNSIATLLSEQQYNPEAKIITDEFG